ncbi:hypothetical protein KR038_008732, partial [Drosophila bunnanda]
MLRLAWPLLLIALSLSTIHGQNSTNRIIGGSSVDIKEAPYQANIIVDGSPCCSGAIIGEKKIVTAAGCVYGCPTSSVRVRVGSSSREGGGTLARVCGISTQPQYSADRYDNNLAILELCEPLKFTDSIKSIDVADMVPDDLSLAVVTGWGSTSWWGSWWDRKFGSLPDQLQVATVSIYNREQCAYDLSGWFWVSDYGVSDLTLCTYSYNKAACSYDIGAPLVKDHRLVGILSYGGCTKYPDVYANLIRFRSWLAPDKTTTNAPTSTTSSGKPAGSTD